MAGYSNAGSTAQQSLSLRTASLDPQTPCSIGFSSEAVSRCFG